MHTGDGREYFSAIDLCRGVSLPESAAGDLGHLHIVGHEPLVHSTQHLQILIFQLDMGHVHLLLLLCNFSFILAYNAPLVKKNYGATRKITDLGESVDKIILFML